MDEIEYKGIIFKRPEERNGSGKYSQRTSTAIKKGKLIRKPCEICGDIKSDGHHEVYSTYDKVRWLCRKHHKVIHYLFYIKKEKMEEIIKIQIDIPAKFSYELDSKLLDLKTTGVRKSKAQYIIELAQLAFHQKKTKSEIQ